jgi:hypothetical protein
MIEFPKLEAFFEPRAKDALLFTYDAYMDIVRLQRYVPSAREPRVLKLMNYKLWFPKHHPQQNSGIASLIRSIGDEVWGIGWRCNAPELKTFEQKLAMPNLYHVLNVRLANRGSDRMSGWSYQITLPDGVESSPSKAAKMELIEIGKSVGLPGEYLIHLAGLATLD